MTEINHIKRCLKDKEDFLLSGGAGSGKTYTLIQTLNLVFNENPQASVACITYTNVAASEIKERSPYSKLRVSTIHDFLWEEIKNYQNNIKEIILELIASKDSKMDNTLKFSASKEITKETLNKIVYKNYSNIEEGIISHDDLLKIANKMFEKYPLLAKIINDKFDYIFIDEYQDTQELVIEIFLKYLKQVKNNSICIGFFGDSMQSIYNSGVGDISEYVNKGLVKEVIKKDNYRSSVSVIKLLNNIRSDIQQVPAKKDADGLLLNKEGSVTFLYSSSDFNLENLKNSRFVKGWDFKDISETKVLHLTHRLNADAIGFSELLNSYKYNEKLLGDEIDLFARHILKVGGIISNFKIKNYSYIINEIDTIIKSNDDKKKIVSTLKEIAEHNTLTIHQTIEKLHSTNLVCKDKRLIQYLENNSEFYGLVRNLPHSQILAYYDYYQEYTPYSTQHGVKGSEFNNVLVVLNNGKWNLYNFKCYFEECKTKATIVNRTKKIFYVCCSRAKENLIVYYPNPSEEVLKKAKIMFGGSNVHAL